MKEAALLQLIQTGLNGTVKIGQSFLREFPGETKLPYDDFILINYLKRVTLSLIAVMRFVDNLKSIKMLETSIGLLLRSNMHDFIVLAYGELELKKNKEALKKFLFQLDYDQYVQLVNYLKTAHKGMLISSTDKEEKISTYAEKWEKRANEAGYSQSELKKHPSIPKMFKAISKSNSNYAMSYDIYKYYSQFEHFGILTHFLIKADDTNLTRIAWAIIYSTISINIIGKLMEQEEHQLKAHKFAQELMQQMV